MVVYAFDSEPMPEPIPLPEPIVEPLPLPPYPVFPIELGNYTGCSKDTKWRIYSD